MQNWASAMRGYPARQHPSYDLGEVDLLRADPVPDIAPLDGAAQHGWAQSLACDAVIYGLPAVYQYVQLHATVLQAGASSAFNRFDHESELAGPGYSRFKTPNVDTLYSSAWLDLSRGPVELQVPAMGSRYYTVHFLDAYSNATNLSSRTLGGEGGRIWVATTGWNGAVPEGVRVFRVATPYMWILLRIFAAAQEPLETVHQLQQAITLTPIASTSPSVAAPLWPAPTTKAEDLDAATFLRLLDTVLRRNGNPVQEDALVYRFRGLGLGLPDPLDPDAWTPALRAAVEAGYETALHLVRSVMGQRGVAAGDGGWRTLMGSGAYGFNYVHRAATNYVGLGATTREESGPYTALVDSDGATLDGRFGPYRIHLLPPPVDAFWSLTLYDVAGRELVENEIDRYAIGSSTPGLPWEADGSLVIDIASTPEQAQGTWLPAPSAPFYLVLRAYAGHDEVVTGEWTPAPVRRLAP